MWENAQILSLFSIRRNRVTGKVDGKPIFWRSSHADGKSRKLIRTKNRVDFDACETLLSVASESIDD